MRLNVSDGATVESKLIAILGEDRNQWVYRADLRLEQDLWRNLCEKITQNNLAAIGEHPLTGQESERIKTGLLERTHTPFGTTKWLKGEDGTTGIIIERESASLGAMSLILYPNYDIGEGISSYEVMNQITKKSTSSTKHDCRLDMTLLIDESPTVQIELRQVIAKDGVLQVFNQIKGYTEEGMFRNNIFSTLQLFVVSSEQITHYFANVLPQSIRKRFLFNWRTKDNEKVENLYGFYRRMLDVSDAHRLIADYAIVSEEQDNRVLTVLHPYQIHATEVLYVAASEHTSGYIWHAIGSERTLTSFVSAKLLVRKPGIDRTIMLLNRKDLDNQTTNEPTKFVSEFSAGISSGNGKASSLTVEIGSAKELSKTPLVDVNFNVVTVTTRQKLGAALKYTRKREEQGDTGRFQKPMG